MPKTTFLDLGIPFPLFEGKVAEASEYIGACTCSVCKTNQKHCFELGIGCALMIACEKCGTINGLDADDRDNGTCFSCSNQIPFPSLDDEEEIAICYTCLRSGKGSITKDTELGMISWEQTCTGVTHGIPGMDRDDFEMVPTDSDWVGAKLDKDIMHELLRTPTFNTIQGEVWQFCCGQPMVFIGSWSRKDFSEYAEDGDGESLFKSIIQDEVPGLWENQLHDETGIYVFECKQCGVKRATWDLA
jgi:uncharacterized protein CbrC (UPF0167 family)